MESNSEKQINFGTVIGEIDQQPDQLRKRRKPNLGSSGDSLDLNEEVGIIENLGLNLDLNKELEVEVEAEGGLDRVGIIDLNVDVNVSEVGGVSEEEVLIKRKDRDFDLNLGFEDGMKSLDVEVDCENRVSRSVEEERNGRKSGSESMDVDENVGSESRGKRGRNRMKITETVLRRSSRRGRVGALAEPVSVLSSLDGGDDSSSMSGVSEEKVVVPNREETGEGLDLSLKVELPSSSGRLNLEGMSGFDVFSVYSFLRSFSMLLFLSPFELEDFVAAVRCNGPNPLFDSIHVSLLHTLRKHMVSLGDDSLQRGCDCLRYCRTS